MMIGPVLARELGSELASPIVHTAHGRRRITTGPDSVAVFFALGDVHRVARE